MGTSVLHIKTEVECRVYLFDEEKGIVKPGTYFNLEVRKGEQDLLFVSTEDEAVLCFMSYNVEEGDCDYRMSLEQSKFINVDTPATEEEISSGVEDELGVVYSLDGMQLLRCKNGGLKGYKVHNGCKVIRAKAFQGYDPFFGYSLSSIILPDYLTHIGNSAFAYCTKLTAVTLPSRLTHIGCYAFFCTRLTTITLPSDLIHIGDGAFSSTDIRNVVSHTSFYKYINSCLIDEPNHKLIAFLSTQEHVVLPMGLKYIGNSAFSGCKKLTTITLPTGLTHMGDFAFLGCNSLTTVTLPDSLIHIGHSAFSYCEKLSAITLPDMLTHIGDSAFMRCKNLKTIILPAGLTHISNDTFMHCKSLTNVIIPTSITHIGSGAFSECIGLTTITLPDGLIHIGENAFSDCSNLSVIILPIGLKHIENKLFYRCKSLTTITLPTNLKHIGDSAFEGCESLTDITLPADLMHIGDSAFEECKSLTDITLPVSLTHIGVNAFRNTNIRNIVSLSPYFSFNNSCLIDVTNHKLNTFLADQEHVILPDGLTHIGERAFNGCNLTTVTLPNSLTYIENGAFKCCINLTTIILPEKLTHIGQFAFYHCLNLSTLTLPTRLTHVGDGAFEGCENLTTITLPDGLTTIGKEVFKECKKLTTITLPNSLTHIGNGAFAKCENLTTITFPNGLTYIGDNAFCDCKSLTDITLPDGLKYIGNQSLPAITPSGERTSIHVTAFLGCDHLSRIIINAGLRTYFQELIPKELHNKLVGIINNGDNIISNNPPYYLFFDTETTGVPRDYNAPASNTRNWPRLVQLGWIVTDEEGDVLSQGNEIVKPEGFVIPADAAQVHGINTEKAQREGKPLREVIEAFLKDAEQAKCIVGHNISFDQKVVVAELYRLGIPDTISTAKSLCTMQAGKDYCKIQGYYGYKWPKLQELHNKLFGCDFEDTHDAMADITATKKCFFEMRKRGLI